MSTNELIAKIRELRELQALQEELTAEIEMHKDLIKLYMGDSEELRAGEYKVTWQTVKTQRIDTSALKKAMPDVAAAFTRESVTRRFSVA